MTMRLDVSIGPVQRFVSQSRRTRDLWGSSYLLAFLSAHAMRGAQEAGGEIVQPVVTGDHLYRWVSGDRSGSPPRIGTVPNHFVVKLAGDARPVADAAVASLDAAWRQACDAVWARYVEHACSSGNGTDKIWRRQVGTFWDVSWTVCPWDDRRNPLARRKHWRTHRGPDEPGDKCTVMHDLQELSGYVRARHGRQQDEFWDRVAHGLGKLELRDNERLCAVALVKRLFPKVARDALGWPLDASRWPSTVYVGAVRWMQRVMKAVPDQAREYAAAVRQSAHDDVFPMHGALFSGLNTRDAGDFPKLDGNYLHREFVTSERLCPLNDRGATGVRERLAELLKKVYAATDRAGHALGPPPSFYALLLADGDRLGELVGKLGGPIVSNALASFTTTVPHVVAQHLGVTVYAGGDDVLAMLPVAEALSCANDVADAYQDAFAEVDAGNRATISAAVVFAHVRLPLRSVLDEAHTQLDAIAKDGNGRDSLAAAVLKPGGRHCQWVTSWTRPAVDGSGAVAAIDGLVQELRGNTAQPGLSGALVYRLRQTLTALCGWDRWEPGAWGEVPPDLDIPPFLRAEICDSLDVRTDNGGGSRADDLTDHVRSALGRCHATEGSSNKLGVDALLLARFLAEPEQQESDR